jgi:hypothetical protein
MSIFKKAGRMVDVFITDLFFGYYMGDDVHKLHRSAQNRKCLAQKAINNYLRQLSYLRPYDTECADSLRQNAMNETVREFIDEY